LRAHASLLAAEGNVLGAVHSGVILLRILRLYEHEPPIFINYLTTAACRSVAIESANVALRAGPAPEAAHKELEQELTMVDGLKGYQQALKTERAYVIQNFDAMALNWANPWVRMDQCAILDLFSEQLMLADRTYAEAMRSPNDKPQAFAMKPMTRLMAPPI